MTTSNFFPVEVNETPKIMSNGSITLWFLHFGGWEEAMSSIKPLTDFISPPGKPLEIKGIWSAENYTSFYEYAKTTRDAIYVYTYLTNRLIHDEDFTPEFATLLTDGIKDAQAFHHCNGIHVGGNSFILHMI